MIKAGNIPQIRIHEVQIKGPFYESWPPKTQKAVLGQERFQLQYAKELMRNFASRAYRRPVKERELELLMAIVDAQMHAGKAAYFAFKDGLKAVLSSPNFLYLSPIDSKRPAKFKHGIGLTPVLFLWSSMPDQTLMDLAKQGKLADPKVRVAQMKRMLQDPKGQILHSRFCRQLAQHEVSRRHPTRSQKI